MSPEKAALAVAKLLFGKRAEKMMAAAPWSFLLVKYLTREGKGDDVRRD